MHRKAGSWCSRARLLSTCVALVLFASGTAGADVVIDWNARAAKAALAACLAPGDDPFHESRIYAMMHVAVHDALNAIDRRSRPYSYRAHALPETSADAAVAAAAHDVLVATLGEIGAPFPPACPAAGVASVEADYATALGAIPDGPAKARGIALGRASAAAILMLRTGDGSDTPLLAMGYPQGSEPGEYRDPPGRTFTLIPGWADVKPFVLKRAWQFRPGPPYHVRSKSYADDLNEVNRFSCTVIASSTWSRIFSCERGSAVGRSSAHRSSLVKGPFHREVTPIHSHSPLRAAQSCGGGSR